MSTRLEIRIRADKTTERRVETAVEVSPGKVEKRLVNPDTPGVEHEPWPFKGVEIVGYVLPGPDKTLHPGPPAEFDFPTRWVRQEMGRGWLTLEGVTSVVRPSQAVPEVVDGSCVPAAKHFVATGALDDPKPHEFLHADYIVLDTLNYGVLRYKVISQPDKYADNSIQDARGRTVKKSKHTDADQVTREIYDAGETRVDHFYRAVLEG